MWGPSYTRLVTTVRATVNYCVDTGVKPVTATTGPGGRLRARSGGKDDPREVEIHDVRGVPTSLDREGFVLVTAPTAVDDFWNGGAYRPTYDREIERLIAEQTGARRVVVFDHTLRSELAEHQSAQFAREPVQVVHNDYTQRSAQWRVRDVVPDEADALLQRRFAVVQVWRPIAYPVESHPLALCDAATLATADLVAAERRHVDRVGEIYQVAFNPAHRWCTVGAMRPDEALVFKVFDTAVDGRARFGAHTAFVHPRQGPDSRPRQSLEVRTLAFF